MTACGPVRLSSLIIRIAHLLIPATLRLQTLRRAARATPGPVAAHREQRSAAQRGLTPVRVVQEDEAVPLIVVQQAQERAPQGRPQLQHELALALRGETGCDEGDV